MNFKASNLLDAKVADNLISTDNKTPRVYLLPKIHKVENSCKGKAVPGRPVISYVNCHTSKISKFVDYNLQPIVKKLKSYTLRTLIFAALNFADFAVADSW